MKNKWIILGCGGHARSVADVILFNDSAAKIVFLDKNAKQGEVLLGFPVVADYEITSEKLIVGVGDNEQREVLSKRYYKNLTNVISKRAYVAQSAVLGKGIFIAHDAHVGVLSSIEDFVVVNTGAVVDHECKVEKTVFIGPNSTLCGKVCIGSKSFLGASSTITPDVVIAEDTIVGAGSVVTKNIEVKGIYVGCPARRIK